MTYSIKFNYGYANKLNNKNTIRIKAKDEVGVKQWIENHYAENRDICGYDDYEMFNVYNSKDVPVLRGMYDGTVEYI